MSNVTHINKQPTRSPTSKESPDKRIHEKQQAQEQQTSSESERSERARESPHLGLFKCLSVASLSEPLGEKRKEKRSEREVAAEGR
jgi:hypothetical protein